MEVEECPQRGRFKTVRFYESAAWAPLTSTAR